MSTMNPFQFDTVARERQLEIEARLQRGAQLRDALSQMRPSPTRAVRAALIVALTTVVSLLLAWGVSYSLVSAFAIVH